MQPEWSVAAAVWGAASSSSRVASSSPAQAAKWIGSWPLALGCTGEAPAASKALTIQLRPLMAAS